jgi:hypothetical protein
VTVPDLNEIIQYLGILLLFCGVVLGFCACDCDECNPPE